MIFPTQYAMKMYMKKHPNADRSNHKVMPSVVRNIKPKKPHRNAHLIKPIKAKKARKAL